MKPSPGLSLRFAYRPKDLKQLEAIIDRHSCAACGKTRNYVAGDNGPRRTLAELVYYRVALQCRCGFMNLVHVVINNLPEERRPGAPLSKEAFAKAEEAGALVDPMVEQLLVRSAAAGFPQDWRQATRLAEDCLERAPKHPGAWFNRGWLHVAAGELEEGLWAYMRTTHLSDEFPSAWLNMGNVYQTTGQLVLAVNCFDQFLARHPDHADATKARDECLAKLEDAGSRPGHDVTEHTEG